MSLRGFSIFPRSDWCIRRLPLNLRRCANEIVLSNEGHLRSLPPQTRVTRRTCTEASVCDSLPTFLSNFMAASTSDPEPDWKLHLLMQHFLAPPRQACSLYIVPSLGYVITLPRTAGSSPSVATQGDAALRGVCSPHAATLLPHDMLKMYICTAAGSGRRNHGNMGDGLREFQVSCPVRFYVSRSRLRPD